MDVLLMKFITIIFLTIVRTVKQLTEQIMIS